MMNVTMKKFLFGGMVLGGMSLAIAEQPPITIPVVNAPCQDGPKLVGGKPESVETPLDDGFVSIFNGKDLTGWWENCAPHTTDKVVGGVWIVDPSSKILYSREEGPNGDILMTNQDYSHYEFIMDLWPTYGNDGGIFNRVTKSGKNWQTTIDYIQGSGVGGSFNEGGWQAGANINDDPFRFGSAGPSNPDITSWTTYTKDLQPASFGCSSTGCIGTDFPKIWNTDGWNQLRIKFYDGLEAGKTVKMESWIRKVTTPESPWVPVYKNEKPVVTPAAPIAIQIHGGGRWKAGSYNLYRNIKVRKLNADGTVPTSTMNGNPAKTGIAASLLRLDGGLLAGNLASAATITLRDVRGNVVERFEAPAGELRHALSPSSRGILFAELKSDRDVSRVRLNRI